MKIKYKTLLIGSIFLICSCAYSSEMTEISQNISVESLNSAPKTLARPKKPKKKRQPVKMTADRIWEKHYEIYVMSDPDLPEPGFGSYNSLIETASRISFSKAPNIIGGMESVYEHLKYPTLLKKMEIGGKIHVMAYVETDSLASSVRIMNYSSKCKFYEFEKAACEAIEKVRFNPAEMKDKLVSSKLYITVEFIPEKDSVETNQVRNEINDLFFGLPVDPPLPLPKGSWEKLWNKAIKKAEKGMKGYTVIRTYIDENGIVLRTRSIRPSPKYPERDEAAISVIKNTKFKPAMLRGEIPVGAWFNIPMIFKLNTQ